uniref:RNase H, putative n=1 Tax=Neospora caninum (strain Liverpool) TaxID=572307 RepID=A0A0F7U6K8_NEOCL|nr:TPA: RNase H, putative [Neospora caninum Liverpool]
MINPPLHQKQPWGFGRPARATEAASPRGVSVSGRPSFSPPQLCASREVFPYCPLAVALSSVAHSSVSSTPRLPVSASRTAAPRSSSAAPAVGPAGDSVSARAFECRSGASLEEGKSPVSPAGSRPSPLAGAVCPRDEASATRLTVEDHPDPARGVRSPIGARQQLGGSEAVCEAPSGAASSLNHPRLKPRPSPASHVSSFGTMASVQRRPRTDASVSTRVAAESPLGPSGAHTGSPGGRAFASARPVEGRRGWSVGRGFSGATRLAAKNGPVESWVGTLSPAGLDEQASVETSASSAAVERESPGLWSLAEVGQGVSRVTPAAPSLASSVEEASPSRLAATVQTSEEEQESPWTHLVRESNQPFAPVIGHYVEGFTSSSSGSSTSVSPSPRRQSSPVRRRVGSRAPGDPVVGGEVAWYPRGRSGRHSRGRSSGDREGSDRSSSSEAETPAPEAGLFGMHAGSQFLQLSRALLGADYRRSSDPSSDADSDIDRQRLEQQQLLQELRLRTLGLGAGHAKHGRASAYRRARATAGAVALSATDQSGSGWVRTAAAPGVERDWGGRAEDFRGFRDHEEGTGRAGASVSGSSSVPQSAFGSRRARGDAPVAGSREGYGLDTRIRRGRSMRRRSPPERGSQVRRGRQVRVSGGESQSSLAGLQLLADGTFLGALLFGDQMLSAEGLKTDDSDVSSGPDACPSPVVVPAEGRRGADARRPIRTPRSVKATEDPQLSGANGRDSPHEDCIRSGDTVSDAEEGFPRSSPRTAAQAGAGWNGETSPMSQTSLASGAERGGFADRSSSGRGCGYQSPRAQRQVGTQGRVFERGYGDPESVSSTDTGDECAAAHADRETNREGPGFRGDGRGRRFGRGAGASTAVENTTFMSFLSQLTGQAHVSEGGASRVAVSSRSRCDSSVSESARGAGEAGYELSPAPRIVSEKTGADWPSDSGGERVREPPWRLTPGEPSSGNAESGEGLHFRNGLRVSTGERAAQETHLLENAAFDAPLSPGVELDPRSGLFLDCHKLEASYLPSQRPSLSGTTISGISSKHRPSDEFDWEAAPLSRRSSQTSERPVGLSPVLNVQRPFVGGRGCDVSLFSVGEAGRSALAGGANEAPREGRGLQLVPPAEQKGTKGRAAGSGDPVTLGAKARTADANAVNGLGGLRGLCGVREVHCHPLGRPEEERDRVPAGWRPLANGESAKGRKGVGGCEAERQEKRRVDRPCPSADPWGGEHLQSLPETPESDSQTGSFFSMGALAVFLAPETRGSAAAVSRQPVVREGGQGEMRQRTLSKEDGDEMGQELCGPGELQGRTQERQAREEREGVVDTESSGSFLSASLSSFYSAWGFS